LPVVEDFRAHDDAGPPRIRCSWPETRDWSARVRGDFDQAELRIDGEVRPLERLQDRLAWRPDRPWPAGDHEARLSVRLAGAGAAREQRLRFAVRPRPARLRVASWPAAVAPSGPFAVRVELLAGNGVRSIDSSRVRIRSTPREAFAPSDTTVVARDGVAWAYLRPRPVRKGVSAQAASLSIALAPAGKGA
jgi:hypothetical protein